MKRLVTCVFVTTALLALGSCGRKSETTASNSSPAATQAPAAIPNPAPTQPPPAAATAPAPISAPAQPPAGVATPKAPAPGTSAAAAERLALPPAAAAPVTTTPQVAATSPAPEKPPPPPKPLTHTYTLPAGTPIAIRTVGDVSSKVVKNGNEFQAVLESPLAAEGHTFAKSGATVVGTVVSADQGGRVKGKASLTLAVARIQLTNGKMTNVMTDSVVQQAKSGTKKNLVRTGIATGAGAAIGGIAGGGQGAAIGAGVGAGAGVATNVATRGPAADVPAETVLNFTLKNPIMVTVTEKPSGK